MANNQSRTVSRIENDPIGTDTPILIERCDKPIGSCHLTTRLCHAIHRQQGETIPEDFELHKQLDTDNLPSS